MLHDRKKNISKYGGSQYFWSGPYQIDNVLGENSFYLIYLNGYKFPSPITVQDLKNVFSSNI